VVATDDRRIFSAVTGFGGKAIMTAAENRSGTDRVAEAAEQMNLSKNDIVVNIQGDQPRIHPSCIQEVVAPLIENPDIQMSTLAFKIINPEEITHPKDVKVTFDVLGNALYFSRSAIPFGRDASTVFDTYKHLGIYAYTRRFLDIFRSLPDGRLENIEKLEQLRAMEYGYRIRVMVTEHDSPEVDVPEDIAKIVACHS
jgi:3-deoxy-manno-octulosonate cytidylyltransferase (CMP-KDO synthetase)